MKITVLSENTSQAAEFTPEHGLSLYIETGDHKILFDMGQSDLFAYNAENLGIDLSRVDIAILSHGHYDHGGGLRTFLQINGHAPVYLHKDSFGAHYNGEEKFIGLDSNLRDHPRLVYTRGQTSLAQNLILLDCNDQQWKCDNWGLMQKTDEGFLPDTFTHEQYLLITEGEKKVLFSGCSHKGILNIARHFQPNVLIGGFHLNKLEDEPALLNIAQILLQCGGTYYTGHCTGQKQYLILKDQMHNRLEALSTGKTFTL